ncbi:SAM-dependent methyltransferase [Streptomyces iconiensis]|uniref:SAM-dependent methyltransferase n=1 Tax=Streptomyces iconiensis TaxID=1384038 RepID=A0ABT6ZPZ4_9ACTN|nr:SAM-dependent methyltransferase [Streptomyces iconiensis]MDJ1131116.1 SAM-dependent methyltransferase [Streptomyces iconiensis]
MERPAWAPQGIDLNVPSVSRMYDYYLGGSHNFEVDRDAARRAIDAWPGLPKIMQTNRAFLRRAIRFAVSEGVTQFLDIGSGIPTFGNVHEVAQALDPEARVVYVDNDPVAVAHSRAVLAGDKRVDIVSADFRSPQDILESPEVEALLDLDRPVALMLVALLHFIEDKDEPHKAVAELARPLAPGSLLVLSHGSPEGGPRRDGGIGLQKVYSGASAPLVIRSKESVGHFFDGFTMVEPGLVSVPRWRPDSSPELEDAVVFGGFAGVGRKAGLAG